MKYWDKRTLKSQERLTNKNIEETEKQLIKYYNQAMVNIIGSFEATYDKLLSTIERGKEPTPADLYKLGKYWELQNQLRDELQKLGDKTHILLSKKFLLEWEEIYKVWGKDSDLFNEMERKNAQQMINHIWCADGKSWSERVWTNTDKLQETLNTHLLDCVLTGKKTTELKHILQEDFNVGYRRADSLVRTEMANIQTQAARERYKDYGIKEVEVLADKDERRCDICGKLHKKRFSIYETIPIPAHPNCRCCIVPVVE